MTPLEWYCTLTFLPASATPSSQNNRHITQPLIIRTYVSSDFTKPTAWNWVSDQTWVPCRQEDAHEFLKYLIDSLQRFFSARELFPLPGMLKHFPTVTPLAKSPPLRHTPWDNTLTGTKPLRCSPDYATDKKIKKYLICHFTHWWNINWMKT